MQLNQIIESKDLLSEIEFALVEYQLYPSDRKNIYWNLYIAYKNALTMNKITWNVRHGNSPAYYLELAYKELYAELNNRYLKPKEIESLKNNVKLNKDIILEWNRFEKKRNKKNREAIM